MSRKLSDEKIISALMNSGSIADAAEQLQITRKTIYERMKNPEFMQLYNQVRGDAVRSAADKLTNRLSWSVDAVSKICQDNLESDPKTALSAAKIMLEMCLRYIEVTSILERLAALEQMQPVDGR